jgi:hypothetical protein
MSQRILSVLSEESMLASTSHECNTVSPIIIIFYHQHHEPHSLTFKEMIQTAIPRDLKFRPNAHGSSTRFGDDDTFDNAFHISLYSPPPTAQTGDVSRGRIRVPGNPSPIDSASYMKVKNISSRINQYERNILPSGRSRW